MYRYLLIDFDNTLMDFNENERRALAKAVKDRCGREITEAETEAYHRINDGYWKKLERKEINKEQLKYSRFYDFTREIGVTETDINALNKYYMDCLATTSVEYPESYEALKKLAGQYELYIITNGTTYIQKARLETTSFRSFIREMFISDEIGVNKPAPEFFDAVEKATGDPDRSRYLIVGDSVSSDIRFGFNTGIDTCFVGTAESGAKYRIGSIAELPELLERIQRTD
ncbi:MAG: HAD-IA family hydrolase [Lachnospiraceae bacterium]|nr:HAD-IA family hydrolase [Lachnospiraceae bacterium]